MVWCRDYYYCGYSRDIDSRSPYSYINFDKGTAKIAPIGQGTKNPYITVVDENELLYIVAINKEEIMGINMDSQDKVCLKSTLTLDCKAIKTIMVGKYYLVVIRSDNVLRIYSKHDNS